jgi:hypothetical protein
VAGASVVVDEDGALFEFIGVNGEFHGVSMRFFWVRVNGWEELVVEMGWREDRILANAPTGGAVRDECGEGFG